MNDLNRNNSFLHFNLIHPFISEYHFQKMLNHQFLAYGIFQFKINNIEKKSHALSLMFSLHVSTSYYYFYRHIHNKDIFRRIW